MLLVLGVYNQVNSSVFTFHITSCINILSNLTLNESFSINLKVNQVNSDFSSKKTKTIVCKGQFYFTGTGSTIFDITGNYRGNMKLN